MFRLRVISDDSEEDHVYLVVAHVNVKLHKETKVV